MTDYVSINNYSGLGQMGISRWALAKIASKATEEVSGATLSKRETRIFQVSQPVRVAIHHDGRADISISVNIKEGAKVGDICLRIQESVATAVALAIEAVPVSVKVRVDSIG